MTKLSCMELLEIELGNKLAMLESIIDSQKGKPTKEQKKLRLEISNKLDSVSTYNSASTNIEALVANIKPSGILKNALNQIDRWSYVRGNSSYDSKLKIWLTQDKRPLFYLSILNRLMTQLRRHYHEVVFVKFIIVGDGGLLTEEKEE